MKYLIILIILSFCSALLYLRLRPYIAAAHGFVDEVIEASHTRPKLIAAFRMLASLARDGTKKQNIARL